MLFFIYGVTTFLANAVLASASDFLGNESDTSDIGNLTNCEPIILTGSTEERSALVDRIYNMDFQGSLLTEAQEAALLCGEIFNTTITTHFEGSNAVTFIIHVNSESEKYRPAFHCLTDNYRRAYSIRPEDANLEEVLAEENCEMVREILWWLDMAELRILSTKV